MTHSLHTRLQTVCREGQASLRRAFRWYRASCRSSFERAGTRLLQSRWKINHKNFGYCLPSRSDNISEKSQGQLPMSGCSSIALLADPTFLKRFFDFIRTRLWVGDSFGDDHSKRDSFVITRMLLERQHGVAPQSFRARDSRNR